MISTFNRYCVEYLVIGGIAVRTYVENRVTQVVQKQKQKFLNILRAFIIE
jgi:hypothetical protein